MTSKGNQIYFFGAVLEGKQTRVFIDTDCDKVLLRENQAKSFGICSKEDQTNFNEFGSGYIKTIGAASII